MAKRIGVLLTGLAGCVLLFFVGWEYNIPMAAWIALPLLLFCFRQLKAWYLKGLLCLAIVASKFFNLHGGWHIDIGMEIAFAALVSMPLLLALCLDGVARHKLRPVLAVFVFPIVYTAIDFMVSFSPLGMVFALAGTQARFLLLSQAASLAGSWFTGFLIACFAPISLACIAYSKTNRRVKKSIVLYGCVLFLVLCYGAVRQAIFRPASDTVRVGSVTAAHPIDFWAITDEGTKPEKATSMKPIMQDVNDTLFARSEQCALAGAKIIFASEGNFVLYEDDYPAFLEKAKRFAIERGVYFMPAVLVLQYGKVSNLNYACMISPQGELLFQYEKTNSWYPSTSDGIIHTADTPYGRIASVICFDMDFPAFVRQAKDADIMLVPAMDTKKAGRYHTEVSLLRAVEYGFSVVRQDNDGVSMAVDADGYAQSYQDFFRTDHPIMLSDIPMQGKWTLYGWTGEWFAWANCAALMLLLLLLLLPKGTRLPLVRHCYDA